MKFGIRLKLFIVSMGLIAVTVTAMDLWISDAIAAYVTASVRRDLTGQATAIAHEAGVVPLGLDDVAGWDATADELGRSLDVRVTFVRADGLVLGDSDVDVPMIARLENHGDRPEVAEALASRAGTSERLSGTVRERLLYIGVAFERDGRRVGVVRVARRLRDVDAAVADARRVLYVASSLAFGLAAALAFAAAHRISRTVRRLTDVARRMATGDLDARARDEDGDELGALSAALDALATDLASTLEELREERDLQTRILQGMQEGVLVLDAEDRILLANAALRSMLLVGGDVQGRHVLEVLRVSQLADLLAVAHTRGEPATAEIPIEGIKPRRILVHLSPLEGAERGVLLVFVDVTDVRRLETMRRDFVANVSHELRTPVAAVLSATETLRAGAMGDPDAAERFLSIVERNAQRLQALIEDLLDLSRVDAKEYRLRSEPLDPSAVLSLVASLHRERAERKSMRLVVESPSTDAVVETDARALEQILGNLVDNAIKHCPSGSTVRVKASSEGGVVRFVVEDDGPGIDASHLPRLFERFYRVDAGRSREVGGTGLGLSIVKHLTEAIGGTVGVSSTVGRGTSFVLDVPSSRAASKRDVEASASSRPAGAAVVTES